jgi:hypothetical protein
MPHLPRQLVPKNELFAAMDICCQNSSGHKGVKFGKNTYLYWDYNLRILFSSKDAGLEMSHLCSCDVEWPGKWVTGVCR